MTMTKAEYNKRLAEIQADIVEKGKAEDMRHNLAVGAYRSEFRTRVAALNDEFRETGDVSDKNTIVQPIFMP
jgi:hypothetical protein